MKLYFQRYAKKREVQCDPGTVCCRNPYKRQPFPNVQQNTNKLQCGVKSSEGINGKEVLNLNIVKVVYYFVTLLFPNLQEELRPQFIQMETQNLVNTHGKRQS